MNIEYRSGDLFQQDLPALAHGVNCLGVMGAGIATEFRRRWPAMYAEYRHRCNHYNLKPGDVMRWNEPGGTVIYNLATQDQPGPHATLEAVQQAVIAMLADAEATGIPQIGMPRIGAGIGGLHWPHVASLLEDIAADSPVRLVVVSLPKAEGPAA